MNRNGQFFLILTVIIITVIAGLATMINFVEKKDDSRFYYAKDELAFESEKVIDYSISNEGDVKADLTTFVQDYSAYSNADNFYFVFGTTSEIRFAGLQKKNSGTVNVDFDSTGNGIGITLNQGSFTTSDILATSSTGTITVNGITYSFTLNQGQNFFFVVSKEIEGDVYTITNG